MALVEVFKVLGDENRLRLINLLMYQELCVCELETILNLTQSNVSRHLNKLKQINILVSNKDAQWMHYSICESFMNEHAELMIALKNEFKNDPFISDLALLKNYIESNLTCTHIKDNKEAVIETIRRHHE